MVHFGPFWRGQILVDLAGLQTPPPLVRVTGPPHLVMVTIPPIWCITFFGPETNHLCAPRASETFGSNFWPSRGGGLVRRTRWGDLMRRTRGGGSGAPHQMGGVWCPHQRGGSGDPQYRPKFDLSKMVQNALKTAPWGQLLSFWPFWTSHWAPEGHCCSTWAIYDLADLASK